MTSTALSCKALFGGNRNVWNSSHHFHRWLSLCIGEKSFSLSITFSHHSKSNLHIEFSSAKCNTPLLANPVMERPTWFSFISILFLSNNHFSLTWTCVNAFEPTTSFNRQSGTTGDGVIVNGSGWLEENPTCLHLNCQLLRNFCFCFSHAS